MEKDVWSISKEVKNYFLHYDWPGNVRELENIVESAINMVDSEHIIKPKHLTTKIKDLLAVNDELTYLDFSLNTEKNLNKILDNIEKKLITNSLERNSNNITKAAKYLGIKRQNLQHKIKKYKIERN